MKKHHTSIEDRAKVLFLGSLTLKAKTKTYWAGYKAFEDGFNLTDCPILAGVERDDWLRGWMSAKLEGKNEAEQIDAMSNEDVHIRIAAALRICEGVETEKLESLPDSRLRNVRKLLASGGVFACVQCGKKTTSTGMMQGTAAIHARWRPIAPASEKHQESRRHDHAIATPPLPHRRPHASTENSPRAKSGRVRLHGRGDRQRAGRRNVRKLSFLRPRAKRRLLLSEVRVDARGLDARAGNGH